MASEAETLLIDVADDGVAVLTLNRPHAMNAWTDRMAFEFEGAIRELDDDDRVRAVVLTGAGRAFCAGADLSSGGDTFQGGGEREKDAPRRQRGYDQAFWPMHMKKPVIAALNGHAIGVGITLPMLCDIRYVAEDAKIQFAFVRRGVLPELGSHAILQKVLGFSNAADLILSGRIIRGREAAELGLATKALPAEDVLPAAVEYARQFKDTAPASVAISKRLLWDGMGLGATDMMKRELPLFGWTTAQPDAREGVLSFVEKRPPEWNLSGGDVPAKLLDPEG